MLRGLMMFWQDTPGHAAPTNSNNADGPGGDLWPHALSEIKLSQLQTVGLGAGGSIWQIAQKLSAALFYCDPPATTSHPLYLLLLLFVRELLKAAVTEKIHEAASEKGGILPPLTDSLLPPPP